MKNSQVENVHAVQDDLISAKIETQLIMSALFPLTLFCLLALIVITVTFQNFTLDLATKRNSTIAQTIAIALSKSGNEIKSNSLDQFDRVLHNNSENIDAFIYDASANLLQQSKYSKISGLTKDQIKTFLDDGNINKLIQNGMNHDQDLVTSAPVPGTDHLLVLVQPWNAIIDRILKYQYLLISLIVIGIMLTVLMLSRAIVRIIQPIKILAENAKRAVPGSVFHPIREQGAQEFRELINAFNLMVIRLSTQQSALRQYAQKALMSQEDERQRISHELHDGTLQDLLGIMQRVELCRNEMNTDLTLASERLDEIHQLLERSLRDVRNISIALRPPILEDLGLLEAINGLCKEMTQSNQDVDCELTIQGRSRRLSSDMELAIFRIVQEALFNIRKHAPNASHVAVKLTFKPKEIKLQISNDGVGISNQDIQSYVRKGHLGLAGMNERVQLFGGKIEITSPLKDNTVIRVQIPIQD